MRLQSFLRLVPLGIVLLCASLAQAGRLTPPLASAFEDAGESAKLPVLISLTEQADLAVISTRLPGSYTLSTADRHAILIDSLKSVSIRTKTGAESSLAILDRNGMIENVEFLWIANLLRANVTRAGAELIANFEFVDEVGIDEPINLMQAEQSVSAESKMLNTESALVQMRAREAWSSGTTGKGTVVGVVGETFKTDHSAFRGRVLGEALAISTYCDGATSVMLGCAVGCDAQNGDTIGVAPEALWRVLPLVCGGQHKFSDVIQLMQASQSGNLDNIPDVILHAWTVGDSCTFGGPSVAWKAFANVEQLGSILIWAAGDNGASGRASIEYPALMSNKEQTFFSVGAVQSDARTLLDVSSRGPSPCDQRTLKPELSAIGVTRTASNNGYANVRSTLCAAGFVAGTVALMRQANPDLTASAAKIALQLSAKDIGVTGEDNEFGYGLLDVKAAVDMAASTSETGTISGVIRYGGNRIVGARVFLVSSGGSYTSTSNADGVFQFLQIPADRKFALYVARFGYQDFIAPDSVLSVKHKDISVSVELEKGIADDAEVDRGFILGVEEDDATAGIWTRAVPVGSKENGKQVQVTEDATAYGSYCFVTGNGASDSEPAAANDVDGGKTTLRTPLFNLEGLRDAKLIFKYAYSNDRGPQKGGDFFRVQISNDGGETWTNLIQTSVSTDGWREAEFKIEDFVIQTDQMLIQFVADDQSPPSLVEAALDDIHIDGLADAPEPPKNLSLTPEEEGVMLTWNASAGASSYKLYLSGEAGHVFAPENFFSTVDDTFKFVPYEQIPYERFYFQVTAVK
jgi:serine protease AprX